MEPYKETPTRPQRSRAWFGCAAALLATSLVACTGAPNDAPEDPAPTDAPTAFQESTGSTATVIDRTGFYFAEITANGTGCPKDSWNVRIQDDGLVFTMTFGEFSAVVDPSMALNFKDCQIAIRVHTPQGRSYAVQSFSYTGQANLEPGVTGRQMANYYFQGERIDPENESRTDLVGPFNDAYKFTDDVPIRDRVWSPCGKIRDLQIVTRIQLLNGTPRASGIMELAAIDGAIGKIELQLDTRACTPEGEPIEPADAGTPTPPADAGPPPPADAGPPPVVDAGNNPAPTNRPTNVIVDPSAIESGQRFAISWLPVGTDPNASYSVQLRNHVDVGFGLVWESPWIVGRGLVYNGPPLRAGRYQLIVVARTRFGDVSSDRVNLEVRGGAPQPPPVVALAKSTDVRINPSRVPRDRPFTVTWRAPANATSNTVYKLQVRFPVERGFNLLWESNETSSLSAVYGGRVLPQVGNYAVVVVARDGTRESVSDPVTLQATDLLRPPPN